MSAPPNSPIEVVIWDLGGVILRTEDRSLRAAWERRLGLEPGELDRLVFAQQVGQQAALGQATPEDVWHWLAGRLGLGPEQMAQLQDDFWRGDRIDTALIDFIRALRSNRRTALLSNAWSGLRREIEGEWAIADAFDEIFISAELGLAKPDPAIYHHALDQLGVRPAQTAFVDDSVGNVQAASRLGIRAVHFQTPEQAMQAVDRLLTTPH